MFKKIAICALIATAALSQKKALLGGYSQVEPQALSEMQQNDAIFSRAQTTARDAYRAKNNGELGNLVSVSKQVVAGVNYKMVFATQNGEIEVVVFSQPWTQTYQVLEMKPVVNRE